MIASKKNTLGDMCTIIDCEHKTAPTEAVGIPLIRTPNIGKGRLILDNVQRISEKTYKLWTRRGEPKPGNLIMAREAPVGNVAIIPGGGKVCLGQRTVLIRVKVPEVNAYYLNYLLNSRAMNNYLNLLSNGATVGHLNVTDIRRLSLPPLPSISDQKKIAAILSAYDDLIENNRRRIALLEKMAEEIYREWFVRLRFPGHEKVKIVKGVPEGWQCTKVQTLASYLKRGVAPQYDDLAEGAAINQKCIRDGKLNLDFARRQSREVADERYVKFGDVLVNSTGEGTLGRVAQVLASLTNCIVDSHVTIVRPKPGIPLYYFGMTLKAWKVHLCDMGRGATNQTELAPSVIGSIEVTMPSKSIQKAFESFAEPVFKQITLLLNQNERLTRTRDMLLPRLISGKLSVENLDIRFPPSMEEMSDEV